MQWIDRIDDRMAAIVASITAALPTRTVKRSLEYYDQHTAAQLTQGVVMPVSEGESEYSQNLGMTAREGKHAIFIVCHLKVAETSAKAAIEDAEMDLIEDIKTWVRAGVPGMSLQIDNAQHSKQLEHPYGWVVVKITAEPPRNNVY